MGELKPEYAAALHRIDIDGVPVKDHATETGITSNDAAVRGARARVAQAHHLRRLRCAWLRGLHLQPR